MLFKNIGEQKKIRLDENPYRWVTVKTYDYIDLPELRGLSLGFEKVKVQEYKEDKLIEKLPDPEVVLPDNDFYNELISIKGIGHKTAKDIIAAYPIKAELLEAIKLNKELPFRENIDNKLIKNFYNEKE
jgi:5'-3' exonuclease